MWNRKWGETSIAWMRQRNALLGGLAVGLGQRDELRQRGDLARA